MADATIGYEIGNIAHSPDHRKIPRKGLYLEIRDEESLADALGQIKEAITTTGLLFFDRYNSFQELDTLFNTPPYTGFQLLTGLEHRLLKGLVIAYLANNERLFELKEIYRQEVEQIGREDLRSEFNTVVQQLLA